MKDGCPYYEDKFIHPIDIGRMKVICFNLSNIFYANEKAVEDYEYSIEEWQDENQKKLKDTELWEDQEVLKLHHEIAFTQISVNLLELAILFRVLDDQKKRENDVAYLDKLKKIENGAGYCGSSVFDCSEDSLRHYCNKIIHCDSIMPLVRKRDTLASIDVSLPCISSEVELSGVHNGKEWCVTLYVINFIECILSVL